MCVCVCVCVCVCDWMIKCSTEYWTSCLHHSHKSAHFFSGKVTKEHRDKEIILLWLYSFRRRQIIIPLPALWRPPPFFTLSFSLFFFFFFWFLSSSRATSALYTGSYLSLSARVCTILKSRRQFFSPFFFCLCSSSSALHKPFFLFVLPTAYIKWIRFKKKCFSLMEPVHLSCMASVLLFVSFAYLLCVVLVCLGFITYQPL